MASMPVPLDANDPINILLMPFDPLPKASALASALSTASADANAQALADAQASQAARDAAAAAAAEEAERQRKLAEEKANLLRQQTVGGKGNATIFGGAEGEVVYESNVRPSGRAWQSQNRVETRRSVIDFKVAEPLSPGEVISDSYASVLSPAAEIVTTTTNTQQFSQPIRVEIVQSVEAEAPVAAASPVVVESTPVVIKKAAPSPRASPKPTSGPGRRAVPLEGAPSVFSPTAGVHPTTAAAAPNKTEEFIKKVGGGGKVRQCPSFRMLEFQIQYDEYKQNKIKTPVA